MRLRLGFLTLALARFAAEALIVFYLRLAFLRLIASGSHLLTIRLGLLAILCHFLLLRLQFSFCRLDLGSVAALARIVQRLLILSQLFALALNLCAAGLPFCTISFLRSASALARSASICALVGGGFVAAAGAGVTGAGAGGACASATDVEKEEIVNIIKYLVKFIAVSLSWC